MNEENIKNSMELDNSEEKENLTDTVAEETIVPAESDAIIEESEDATLVQENEIEDCSIDKADADESEIAEAEGTEEEPQSDAEVEAEVEDEIEANDEVEAEVEDEPEDDIAYVAERITGARHSEVSTAAPIRTRTPEQNRSIGNGIPLRERKVDSTEIPATAEKSPKFLSPLVITVATALLAVIFMITSVLIINGMYIENGEKSRPSDFDMTDEVDPDSIITIDTKLPDRPIQSGEDESDTTESESGTTAPVEDPTNGKYSVTLDFFDGEDITVATERITFGELLKSLGYELKSTDRPNVSDDFVIAADAVITIDKVQYVNVTVTEDIPFETEVIETDLIMRGTTNYLTYGENGMKETLYNVEYVNGVEVNRTYVSEQVTKPTVNEKYEYGVGGTFVGGDGVTYTYSLRRVVPATYYNLEGPTYIGKDADETVIAVDPEYIPLYTVLYVKNDKYDFGKRIAADTGSLIKGWEVDIWLADDNPQLKDFAWIGYHYDMEIYYIDQ